MSKYLDMLQRGLEIKKFNLDILEHTPPARVVVNGKRHYTDGVVTVPSVTTVLSVVDEGKFDWWYEAIGHDKAERIKNQSAYRGSQLHKLAENYLLGRDLFFTDEEVGVFDIEGFSLYKTIHPLINNHIDNIRLSEGMLLSRKLGVAGTLDLLADWDGKLSIIDFKNARRIKSEQDIYSYFIQETMYQIMVYETFGLKVEQIVTLMAVENSTPLIFVKSPSSYFQNVKEAMETYKRKKFNEA